MGDAPLALEGERTLPNLVDPFEEPPLFGVGFWEEEGIATKLLDGVLRISVLTSGISSIRSGLWRVSIFESP